MATESVVVNTAYFVPEWSDAVLGLSLMIGLSPTGIMECPDVPVEG